MIMEKVLVNTNQYDGRYVALKSFEDHTVMGAGDEPEVAMQEARAKGCKDPVLLYIPEKDLVHIY